MLLSHSASDSDFRSGLGKGEMKKIPSYISKCYYDIPPLFGLEEPVYVVLAFHVCFRPTW